MTRALAQRSGGHPVLERTRRPAHRSSVLPLLALLGLVGAACDARDEPRQAPTAPLDPTAYDVPLLSESDLAVTLVDACARARDRDQPLLVEFSATWCGDCRKLHGMKQEPALAMELERWPSVVVNVGRFDRHRRLLAAFDVESIAHWEVLAPSRCDEPVATWPSLAARTLEVSSGAARSLTPAALADWLARLRAGYQS